MKKLDKLVLISWFATLISITGIFFNAYKLILCWPIWIVSNVIWIIWAIKKKEWAQLALWVVFLLTNIFGWYQWMLMG